MENNEQTRNTEKGARIQKGVRFLKIAVFIAIIAGIPLTIFLRYPDFGHILTDRDALSAFLAENEGQNAIIYFVIVVLTVVIGLPIGQVINFAGVFIFGAPITFALSIGGTFVGTFIAFNIARYLGKEFVIMIFKEKNVEKFTKMLDTSKAYVVIIFIYLIPGFPKDIFTYAAGLSSLRSLPFTLTAVAARSPAMLATMLFAHFISVGNYIGVGAVFAVVAAFLIFVLVRRKQLFAYLEGLHEKLKR
ncbi:MAG: VTT domain-containing protein [Clostridiales bacterium]|nr:VTT domain-containing protein [Clostridiales bacterium]